MTQSDPTPEFSQFIRSYQKVAAANNLTWDLPVDSAGRVGIDERWDFNILTGTPKPPAYFLGELGMDDPTLTILNDQRREAGKSALPRASLSNGWQDLIKALVVRSLFETRNGASHTLVGVCRPLRALATCCHEKEPWQITSEDVAHALQTTAKVDKNKKLRFLLAAQVVAIDDNNLAIGCPLHAQRTRQKSTARNVGEIRKSLDERRRKDRLPGARQFWEMLRILLEEQPKSTYDAVRFAAVELAILMGLRAEEIATVPTNPIVTKPYFDFKGRKPSESGGVTRGAS